MAPLNPDPRRSETQRYFAAIVAFAGWLYILIASGWIFIAWGLGLFIVGIGAYLVRARRVNEWPFEVAA